MQDLIAAAVGTFLKVLPVGFASRTALLGVIAITIAGGYHENRNQVEQTRVEVKLEAIQETLKKMDTTLDKNTDKLIAILEEQARVKAELEALRRDK